MHLDGKAARRIDGEFDGMGRMTFNLIPARPARMTRTTASGDRRREADPSRGKRTGIDTAPTIWPEG
jgi:hypothetical protein